MANILHLCFVKHFCKFHYSLESKSMEDTDFSANTSQTVGDYSNLLVNKTGIFVLCICNIFHLVTASNLQQPLVNWLWHIYQLDQRWEWLTSFQAVVTEVLREIPSQYLDKSRVLSRREAYRCQGKIKMHINIDLEQSSTQELVCQIIFCLKQCAQFEKASLHWAN